jgi:hypothetical protein
MSHCLCGDESLGCSAGLRHVLVNMGIPLADCVGTKGIDRLSGVVDDSLCVRYVSLWRVALFDSMIRQPKPQNVSPQ